MSISHSKKVSRWATLLGSGLCAVLVTLSPVTRSLAAETKPAAKSAVLEEITVTAQRREESSQLVPITVDTVSGQQALERGTYDFQSLQASIPNFTFTTALGSTNAYIRGIGSNASTPNHEPSVAFYVDGVYDPSAVSLTNFDFDNVERIEVLKGPQGTLFGRNSTAGVVQVITPDPQHEFSGKVHAGYGNLNTVTGGAYLTTGLSDKLAADLSLMVDNIIDGYGRTITYDLPTWRNKRFAARSKWLYDASDATQVRLALQYLNFDTDGAQNQFTKESFPPLLPPGDSTGERNLMNGEDYSVALTIDHDLATMHFKSITSYREFRRHVEVDSDKLPEIVNEIHVHDGGKYWTQEFHLSNLNPGKVQWLLGAFYFTNDVDAVNPRIQFGTGISPGGYREYYGYTSEDSWSLFGQSTVSLTDNTDLTLGLRYTSEKLDANGYRLDIDGNVNQGPFDDTFSSHPWTWRIALNHQFTPDVMGYVSWNRGFKSGGFNGQSPGSDSFGPEYVDAYEVGVKSEFMDHRVRLNTSVFYYDLTDLQVAVVLGGNQLFTNAASAKATGLDASLDFAATDRLTLSAGLGLLNSEYTDYPGVRQYDPFGVLTLVPNAKGAELPFAPPVTGFLNASYDQPTSNGEIRYAANAMHNGRSYPTTDMGLERPAYTLVSASVEWRSASDNSLSVRLWGRNLLNDPYYVFAGESSTGWYVAYGMPRTYGVSLEKQF
jgi:iron complex outermembrane recepter protein